MANHFDAFRDWPATGDPAVRNVQRAQAAGPELLDALKDAYRFITQPARMDTPKDGPKTATYRIENYNKLTRKIADAIALAERGGRA